MAATRSNITETQMKFLYIIFDRSAGCVSNFRAMVPNLDEWQQVENMHAFENYMCEVIPFLRSAHIFLPIFRHSQCTSSPNLTEAS